MQFNGITDKILTQLEEICGVANVHTAAEVLSDTFNDYTEDFSFNQEVVVKPSSDKEISATQPRRGLLS